MMLRACRRSAQCCQLPEVGGNSEGPPAQMTRFSRAGNTPRSSRILILVSVFSSTVVATQALSCGLSSTSPYHFSYSTIILRSGKIPGRATCRNVRAWNRLRRAGGSRSYQRVLIGHRLVSRPAVVPGPFAVKHDIETDEAYVLELRNPPRRHVHLSFIIDVQRTKMG